MSRVCVCVYSSCVSSIVLQGGGPSKLVVDVITVIYCTRELGLVVNQVSAFGLPLQKGTIEHQTIF